MKSTSRKTALATAVIAAAAALAAAPVAQADDCYRGGRGGFSIQIGGGHHGGYHGGYYQNSYRGGSYARYRERCRIIDRQYFSRGCTRYCRITYLHERVDHCGRVVSCWRTCRTVRV